MQTFYCDVSLKAFHTVGTILIGFSLDSFYLSSYCQICRLKPDLVLHKRLTGQPLESPCSYIVLDTSYQAVRRLILNITIINNTFQNYRILLSVTNC